MMSLGGRASDAGAEAVSAILAKIRRLFCSDWSEIVMFWARERLIQMTVVRGRLWWGEQGQSRMPWRSFNSHHSVHGPFTRSALEGEMAQRYSTV